MDHLFWFWGTVDLFSHWPYNTSHIHDDFPICVVHCTWHTLNLESCIKCWVILFPAIFTLWDSRVYISSSDCHNILSNIETPIDKTFSFCTTLDIPNVNLDNCHVQFRRHFDHSWFRSKIDVVNDLILLDNGFNVT